MDHEFRITLFLPFHNEEGYIVSYDLPEKRSVRFSIGDPAPMPVWHKGKCLVIDGDAYPDVVEAIPEYAKSDVLRDVMRLLHQARTGYFLRQAERWTARDISARFHDVFDEPPVRSRYWISRYRLAISSARKETVPPHPIDQKLRRAGIEWMRRFATKTDYQSIVSMIGESKDGIFGNSQRKQILFGFLVDQLSSGKMDQVLKHHSSSQFREFFPKGLFDFYLSSGFDAVPFQFRKIVDFVSFFREKFSTLAERREFWKAAQLAFVLFGRQRMPHGSDEIVWRVFRREVNDYKILQDRLEDAINEHRDSFFRKNNSLRGFASSLHMRKETDIALEVRDLARELLEQYIVVLDIDGILHEQDRLSRVIVEGRHGMTRYRHEQLQRLAKGEIEV